MLILGLGKNRAIPIICLILALAIVPFGCKKQPSPQQQEAAGEAEQTPEEPVVQAAVPEKTSVPERASDEQAQATETPVPVKMVSTAALTKQPQVKPLDTSADLAEAMTRAVAQGDIDQLQSLIKQGADVNAKIRGDVTFLHIALLQGHEEVAALLIAGGADTHAKMPDGTMPLHLAAMRNCMLIAEFLLDDGSDVNAKGLQGTPLHLAVTGGHREMTQLLVARGADLNAKDNSGRTPLDIARQKGSEDMYELLGAEKTEQ